MIVRNDSLHATVLQGCVAIRAQQALPLAALYLGDVGRPSWAELRRIGPVRFDVEPTPDLGATAAASRCVERNFRDSLLRCGSNAPATSHIMPEHQPCNARHIPTAMGLAFSQQWARLGHACIHGALLAVEGQGVLVLGPRAAGKSVLATSALVAGGGIVSDDYILVGERDGRPIGERIRAYLSLRESWATRTLFDGYHDRWQRSRSGNRALLRIDELDSRFPSYARIDRVWILTRPRAGRRADSLLESISQAELYSALLTSTQPILLGPDFPHERRLLTDLFMRLATTSPARLETGQDIVLDPRQTWNRLLSDAALRDLVSPRK